MDCVFVPEAIDKEWSQSYQMEPFPLMSFAVSTAPNGRDAWLSGGIALNNVGQLTFPIQSKINIVR